MTEPAPPSIEVGVSSPALSVLIERLLAPDPARRPGSARELAQALRALRIGDATNLDLGPPLPENAPPKAPTKLLRGPTAKPESPATEHAHFAPLPDAKRALAVLSFKERAGIEPGFGADLGDELVDALARVRGLRVLSSRATARFGGDAAPEAVGKELSVDFIVDGTVQKRGEGLRVTARLVEVTAGVQIWSERFEGSLDNVVEIEEQIAERIAESLRLELEIVTDRGTAPAPAIELYLTGRKKLRELNLMGEDGAAVLLERAVLLAPTFRPAVAAAALAFVRRAFAGTNEDPTDLVQQTERWVSRALAEAPDLPEAQLAAGTWAAQQGDYVKGARHLRSAVTIAPTYAEAQEYLGHLQCEAGLASEGAGRLMQALALDPLLRVAPADLARHHLFHGRQELFQKYRDEVARRTGGRGAVMLQLDLRAASWRGDWEGVRHVRDQLRTLTIISARSLLHYANYVLSPETEDLEARIAEVTHPGLSPRFWTLIHQLLAKAYGVRGQTARCLDHVQRATAAALVDLEWLEYCPAIECVRKLPEFVEIEDRVRLRTHAIWSV